MITADRKGRREERFWSAIRFAQVRSAKRELASRGKYLPSDLFAEPAWDILLELYSFNLVGRRVDEAEMIERLAVPGSETIQWMKILEVQNLISRSLSGDQPGSVQIELTPHGITAMDGYFDDRGC